MVELALDVDRLPLLDDEFQIMFADCFTVEWVSMNVHPLQFEFDLQVESSFMVIERNGVVIIEGRVAHNQSHK